MNVKLMRIRGHETKLPFESKTESNFMSQWIHMMNLHFDLEEAKNSKTDVTIRQGLKWSAEFF